MESEMLKPAHDQKLPVAARPEHQLLTGTLLWLCVPLSFALAYLGWSDNNEPIEYAIGAIASGLMLVLWPLVRRLRRFSSPAMLLPLLLLLGLEGLLSLGIAEYLFEGPHLWYGGPFGDCSVIPDSCLPPADDLRFARNWVAIAAGFQLIKLWLLLQGCWYSLRPERRKDTA